MEPTIRVEQEPTAGDGLEPTVRVEQEPTAGDGLEPTVRVDQDHTAKAVQAISMKAVQELLPEMTGIYDQTSSGGSSGRLVICILVVAADTAGKAYGQKVVAGQEPIRTAGYEPVYQGMYL